MTFRGHQRSKLPVEKISQIRILAESDLAENHTYYDLTTFFHFPDLANPPKT